MNRSNFIPPAFNPTASGGVWQAHPPAVANTYFPRATSSVVGPAADVGQRHVTVALAGAGHRVHVLRSHVVERRRAQVSGVSLERSLRDVAVTEEGPVEVEKIRRGLAHRLGLAIGHVGARLDDQVVRREPMTMLGEASRVVPDDVFTKTRDGRQARRDRDVVAARPLDRFLAAGDRHPYGRMRRLRGPGPDGDVAIRPEPALVG